MDYPLISGFLLGLSLILAIGSQNAFVLRMGIAKQHIFWICLVCALSDATLITLGVAGFGAIVQATPWLEVFMRYAGAAFLIYYGIKSALSAWCGGSVMTLEGEGGSLKAAVLTCLALTWLNPHVYLDTVVLLGGISSQSSNPFLFGVGAVCASFVFFFALGYGARVLIPIFQTPFAWRILDSLIALTMWAIAANLILYH